MALTNVLLGLILFCLLLLVLAVSALFTAVTRAADRLDAMHLFMQELTDRLWEALHAEYPPPPIQKARRHPSDTNVVKPD